MKRTIKRLINIAGFDLHRQRPKKPTVNSSTQCVEILNHFEIDLVLDIGANVGQFAFGLKEAGYLGRLVSFEPLSFAYRTLVENASHNPKWQVHPRCAIGDFDGEIEINIAGNSESSSVLPMMESHYLASEDSIYVGVEKVPIFKLDTVAPKYFSQSFKCLLKIDTQGYEWQVLDGAHETLPYVHGIICELSLISLYEGQKLWIDMMHRLQTEGFTLWSIQPAFTDPRNGRTLQVDAAFFRL